MNTRHIIMAVDTIVFPRNPKSMTKLASLPPDAPGRGMNVLKRLIAAASEINLGSSENESGAPRDIAAKNGSV